MEPGAGFAGDRLSWDSISSLVTVHGAAPWYKVVSGGTNVTDAKTGINTWQAGYAQAGMCRITSKGAADATTAASKAFDGDDRTAWVDKSASSWIQCQYADGRKYLVTSYAVICPEKQRLPRTLELSGSNDGGIHWTVLDTQKDGGFSEQTQRREFAIAKPAKWNIYRLSVTAADGKFTLDGWPGLGQAADGPHRGLRR
jgi:hypothetical protein